MIAARLRAPCLALVFAAAGCADEGPSKTNHPVVGAENAGASDSSRPWWDDVGTSWKPAAGAPPECSYRVANDPAKVAPRLDWKDCPGVVGCKLFEPGGPPDVKLAVTGHARRGPSGYELAVQLTHYPVQTAVLYDSSGKATWAARAQSSECPMLGPFPGEPLTCLGYSRPGSGESRYACKAHATPDGFIETLTLPQQQLEQFSGELLAMWGTAGTATIYDAVHRTTSVLGAPLNVSQAPRAHGEHAFVRGQDEAGNYSGYVWSRGAGFRPVLQRSPKQVLDLNGDGTWLVWIEAGRKSSSDLFPDAELWRSPFGTTAESLEPRRVRALENLQALVFSVAGNGHYALLKDLEGIDVFRVANGKHWKVKPPRGYVADYVLYSIDDEELFYSARTVQRPIAIVRQRLDALGPGD